MTRKDTFYCFAFFSAPLFFLCGTLTSTHTFFMRDLTYLFHPWRELSAQMLQSGVMPLWNPYEMGGMPFLANCQSAILYPFTILFDVFQFVPALKLFHLSHYALAGLGFYILGKKMGFGRWPSFIMGILFSFNGYSLTRLEFLSILGSLVWFPWILIFCVADIKLHFRALMITILLSFSLFAGFPQIFLLQVLAATLFTFFYNNSKDSLKCWTLTGLIFIALSAPQWIPTSELIPLSIRGGSGVSYEEAGIYSLPVDSLFGLIDPKYMLHNPDQFTGEKYFWIWSAWWGFTATILALIALISGLMKKPPKGIVIPAGACPVLRYGAGIQIFPVKIFSYSIILFILGILWATGDYFDTFGFLFRHIFFLRFFRYPPVALYWTVIAITFLSGLGLMTLERSRIPGSLKTTLLLSAGLLMTLELMDYSRGMHLITLSRYFHVTSRGIRIVQSDHPGTVILSPRIDSTRRLAGMTDWQSEKRFRAYLFDLTNLPYRIRTMMPSGEPLALDSYLRFYHNLNGTKSFQGARAMLNLWNITHLLTYDKQDKSWELTGEAGELKVYRNPDASEETYAVPKGSSPDLKPGIYSIPARNTIVSPSQRISQSFDKMTCAYRSRNPLKIIFDMPYYPGWEAFDHSPNSSPVKLPPYQSLDYFFTVNIPAGEHDLFLIYRPNSWVFACSLCLLTILTATFLSFRKLRDYA